MTADLEDKTVEWQSFFIGCVYGAAYGVLIGALAAVLWQ